MDRWATFDCYGTLVNWNEGMLRALEPLASDRAEALLGAFHAFELEVEATSPHLRYRDVLVESLRRAARRERLPLQPAGETVLLDAWAGMRAFSEVPATLAGLRDDGWRLGVLTNCDDDLFRATLPALGVALDEVVTAEQVRSYKPRLAHFEEFSRRTGAASDHWVHVANSWVHDIVPASRLGIPRIWVDRDRTGHDASLATLVLDDLLKLPDALGRIVPTA
ncbi:MAG TPA: HAD hydrolase-like protein [Actinomycetes bacterium]|jgi:2-haloacid dehalogenase|nr:HAD hydrolase-like protein [Actinomycetes bacterium]